MNLIGNLIAVLAVLVFGAYMVLGSLAAATLGINALFNLALSPWAGLATCVITFTIYIAAALLLDGVDTK